MASKNFKIQNGLDLDQGQVINLGGGALGSGPNPEYPLQWIGNNVATELFVNNALGNINVAQFIESVAPGSPLQVNSGQLSLGLEIGAGRLAVVNVGGANALTVNPDLYAMNSINMIGNNFTISNVGALTWSDGNYISPSTGIFFDYFSVSTTGNVAAPQIQSSDIQATGYINIGVGSGISTNTNDINNSFIISNTGNIERAGLITTGSLTLITPGAVGIASPATITSQAEGHITVAGQANVQELKVGYDSNGQVGTGNLTVSGDTTINGNLTINGTTTTISTQTLLVEDNLVTLNSNIAPGNTAAPVQSGIEVLRGNSPTASLYWDEMSPGWYISDGNTTSQLGASYISSANVLAFTVFGGELGLSVGNGLMLDPMATGLTIDPVDPRYTASQYSNVYSESATMATYLSTANTVTTIGTFAPAVTPRGSAAALRSFEAHVTLVTPSGATRTSKLVGVNNNGTIDYNEYAIVEDATSGFGADITVVDGTANGGQITIEAAHGIEGTLAIAHWTAISK